MSSGPDPSYRVVSSLTMCQDFNDPAPASRAVGRGAANGTTAHTVIDKLLFLLLSELVGEGPEGELFL